MFFQKKGFLRGAQFCQGGDQIFFLARLRAQIVPPPKQKPSYAPGIHYSKRIIQGLKSGKLWNRKTTI